jgi:2,4-dienoyl-CoA reductase-like NADH-dependent reductase (Old Yellow Enzyme family)
MFQDYSDTPIVMAPSAISFSPGKYPNPKEADAAYIETVKKAFVDAVERCKQAGFDFIEIHGAHGYLLHSEYLCHDLYGFLASPPDYPG